MEDKTLKEEFIKFCNDIEEEGINPVNTKCISSCLLSDIFDIYEAGNYEASEREVFEAVTQEEVLQIIEKGIIEYFEKTICNNSEYICNAYARSGLQFLVDYAENHEINENIKKRLQTILTNENTIGVTEEMREFKKSLNNSDYLNRLNYEIDLTNIPLSHDWWRRD